MGQKLSELDDALSILLESMRRTFITRLRAVDLTPPRRSGVEPKRSSRQTLDAHRRGTSARHDAATTRYRVPGIATLSATERKQLADLLRRAFA